MNEYANSYVAYILELVETAKKTCADPVVLIEQRLDFSRYVEGGFGTGDCVVIADGTLYICDYKHGSGILVDAADNPQMKLYALGAIELFDGIYDIDEVSMTIYQASPQQRQHPHCFQRVALPVGGGSPKAHSRNRLRRRWRIQLRPVVPVLQGKVRVPKASRTEYGACKAGIQTPTSA